MASVSDIAQVRLNTDEPGTDTFTDAYIGGLIDASSVAGASATIWEQKAAKFSTAVDVTEAGATHKFSDIFDNAQAMAAYWVGQAGGTTGAAGSPKVKKIERS